MFPPFTLLQDQSEKVRYQSADLPLYITQAHLSQCEDLNGICHWHEDLEFVIVLSGHMAYSVNGELFDLKEGEGIFVNARQLHSSSYAQDHNNAEIICILIHPVLLCANAWMEQQRILPLTRCSHMPYLLLYPETDWQADIMSALTAARRIYVEKKPGFELAVESCYYRIAALLYAHMPQAGKDTGHTDLQLSQLRQMMNHVQEHSREHLTLTDISSSAHICTSGCCHLFQRFLHRTPMEYLTEIRLTQSCELLRNTDLTITEIAGRVGFSGASYYTERFRHIYGQTPTAYRARTAGQCAEDRRE